MIIIPGNGDCVGKVKYPNGSVALSGGFVDHLLQK